MTILSYFQQRRFALEVQPGVKEDTAIACGGGAEESTGQGCRFAEERAAEGAVGAARFS